MSEPDIVKRMKEVMERAAQLNNQTLVVGIPSDKSGRSSDGGITNAELGAIHEFGVPEKGIPERSFMRSTMSDEKPNLRKLTEQEVKNALEGKTSAHDAFAKVGVYLSGKMVEKVADGDFLPDKQSTINKKGSSKPLIDTGQLMASITYEVRERES